MNIDVPSRPLQNFSNPTPGRGSPPAGEEPDQDWQDAGQLMADHGIPAEGHQIMQENLATYLAHRSFGDLSARWQHKVDRELARPFLDEAVGTRLDVLQKSLLDNVNELPAYPSQLYLTGSFSRGRLGANSDLDGYAVMKPEHMSAGFDSYEKRVEDQDASCLFPLSEDRPGYNRANLMMVAGASVAIDPQQLSRPGYLRETYQGVRAARTQRRETAAGYEWLTGKMWKEGMSASQKREEFEGKTFKSRMMNAAMSLGGTLAGLPLVGPVVRWGANLCVHQQHTDLP